MDTLIDFDKQLLLLLNGSSSLYLDALARILTRAATWIPFYLSLFYVVLKNNERIQKILLVLASVGLCLLLAGAVDDMIVKPTVARWRPTHDPQIGLLVDIVDGYRGGSYGFFSAHAANTFSIAVFFWWLIRSRLLTAAMIIWSFTNCWTRLYLGVHYPGDILVGLIWGTIVGSLAYLFYRRSSRHFDSSMTFISTHYTSTGYRNSDINIPMSILIFTLLYALLWACMA